MNKRPFIALLGFFLFVSNCTLSAQEFSPQNGTVINNGVVNCVSFEAKPFHPITSSHLLLEKKSVQKLSKILTKHKAKAEKWAKTAKNENVTDFHKCITLDFETKVIFIYEINGETYGSNYGRDYYLKFLDFNVDKNGECYVSTSCDAGTQEVFTNNKVQSTSSVSNSGHHLALGQSATRDKELHDVGLLTLRIRVTDIDSFIEHLNQIVDELDNNKKDKKEIDKLFK
jgi:hypothetical protein